MKLTNLAVIKGNNVSISDGKITYKKQKKETPSSESDKNTVAPKEQILVRTDCNFSNGKLKFKIKTPTSKFGIQVIFPLYGDNQYAYIGHSFDSEQFVNGIGGENGFNTAACKFAGSLKNYDLSTAHEMVIEVKGSGIKLFVDSVLMLENVYEIKESTITIKFLCNDYFECYDISVEKKVKQAFVVMQFTREFDEIYEEVIRPVCSEFQIDCIRADEYYTSTPILNDIVSSIVDSSIIIAEITPDNPNVFYEIGYAHAINKPVILLSDKRRDRLPFDISTFRTIFYENSIAGKKKVEESLRKFLSSML